MNASVGQISVEESLFFYGAGLSTSNYSNPDYVPSFKSDVVANAPPDVLTLCNGSTECIYDYLVSGNQDVALVTYQLNQIYASQENQACML